MSASTTGRTVGRATGRTARTLDTTEHRSRPLTAPTVALDLVALLALGLVAASPLADAYGGWRWAAAVGGGLALGLLVALVSRTAHLGPWLTAGTLVLVYLVVGPALATPDLAAGGVAPSPDAVRTLLSGVIDAWRDSLTLIAPLGSTGNVLIVPWVIGLLGGVVSGVLVWRSRWPGSAALVVLGILAVSVAFGTSTAEHTTVRGVALAMLLLLWIRWRSMSGSRAAWLRRGLLAAVTLAIVGGAAVGATSLLDTDRREVLRDHVDPPFDPRDYPSPLSKFRAYTDQLNLKNTPMFQVEGVDGGTLVRVATMDYFDGIVWNVTGGAGSGDASGTFVRFRDDTASGDTTDVTITIDQYTGVWVPSVGDSQAVTVRDVDGDVDAERSVDVLHNDATGTVAQVGGVGPGVSYEFETVIPDLPSEEQITDAARQQGVSLEAPVGVPENLTKLVETWIGDAGGAGGDGATVQTIAQRFKDDGFYSDGKPSGYPSTAGHGVKRISDLVERPRQMVGNDEQYASALGVALQNLQVPARVVIGAEVPASGSVTGDDMHAWVEVALDGLGWVPLTPTPPDDQILKEEQEEPDPVPQPYLPQPPQVPDEPGQADQAPPQGAGENTGFDLWGLILAILGVLWTIVKILLLLTPIWGLLLVKWWRRRRRRGARDPVTRLSGGWREVTDRARDLGVRLPVSNTRHQNGLVLDGRFPEAEAPTLAAVADRHVFAPGEPTPSEVDDYWRDVRTALSRMRKSVPWWRRWVAVLSPASIPWRQLGRGASSRARRLGASARRSAPARWVAERSAARRRRQHQKKGTS
ncbi:transglutaminase domain-containing protein [Aeromicrobium sp. Leaf350]|uniref:transglutaminase family protein n=1 Tax=Aeromicrobium sp. Leaf350 TaxID=2876565 RepID=UPI001E532618|nr:transglutaminase domain-containing protein [Aeromicrobium sp. Leaf350]